MMKNFLLDFLFLACLIDIDIIFMPVVLRRLNLVGLMHTFLFNLQVIISNLSFLMFHSEVLTFFFS